MTERAKLTAEIADARRSLTVVSWIVWTVAVVIMIYGIPIVYDLLVDHQVPKGLAWLLSPAVDGALAVGIIATNVLARLNQPYGWVGAIRWIAGITTWGLNTAGPWTAKGGVDWLGVATHTAGPLVLFVLVEGVAQFQHRTGKAIAAMEEKLTALDVDKAKDDAERIALNDRVARLTADLAAAARREREAVERAAAVEADAEREIASIKTNNDTTVAALTAERDALKAETLTLHTNLNNLTEAHNTTLTDTVNALTAKHTEAMARLRAELSTTDLNAFRSTKGGTTKRQPMPSAMPSGGRGVISDEDAVQKLLAHNSNPDHEWSQAEVRRVTSVGFPRAKELINALAEHHRNAAALRPTTRETASPVEAAVTLTDDDKEDHRVA